MLLVIDVGNTNITLGVYKEEKLEAKFRMTTKLPRTSDEYGISMCDLIEHQGFEIRQIDAVIIASVVPDIMHSLTSAIIKYLDVYPLVVSREIETGIKIGMDNPRMGPDRIVDAVAAYEKYGGPVIVVDFGTATTYDMIAEDGSFMGGCIATGIRTSARALWGGAAMLPEIEIKKPEVIMGQETITSMQAGLVYGYIGQTEYIVQKMKKETGLENVKVIATGGLGKIIVSETDVFDAYDQNLTLDGLRILYEKNKK